METPYSRIPATGELARFFRSFHVADQHQGSIEIDSPPTGYPVLGHIFRGFGEAVVEDKRYPAQPMPFNILAGQIYRKRASVQWNGGIGHVAAEMTATGLWELFHIDGSSIINKAEPLSGIAPEIDAAMSKAFLRHGPDPNAFEEVLAPFIPMARKVPDTIDKAVRQIEDSHGTIRVTDAFSDADASMPFLNKLFRKIVGLPPKYFARIVQFNHVAGLFITSDTSSIAELAIEAGYYDQAHFSRVVKEFVLKSPASFLNSDFSRISTFVRLGKPEP
ncbi:AraC-type DNA-binding protein [Pseudovibrio denitrificans]|uniref:AraC-type DNA-binding protein n=1 Tax=Pseudovibrio denitrificans TaxID=258256 RepID=A0A1I7DUH8_9HYPH|nr:helix-turn-helix domain-containing protein [Pseudovibrio denitrificans]SFU15314.1 AraC-type DNA-binding protein [Pseudovibrio denitrificans]